MEEKNRHTHKTSKTHCKTSVCVTGGNYDPWFLKFSLK